MKEEFFSIIFTEIKTCNLFSLSIFQSHFNLFFIVKVFFPTIPLVFQNENFQHFLSRRCLRLRSRHLWGVSKGFILFFFQIINTNFLFDSSFFLTFSKILHRGKTLIWKFSSFFPRNFCEMNKFFFPLFTFLLKIPFKFREHSRFF